MLNTDVARKIGINACIDKLGRDFVLANRDFATSAYGESDDGVFCFVGVEDRLNFHALSDVLELDSQSKFPYRVSCNVSLLDGVPHFIECILPGLA